MAYPYFWKNLQIRVKFPFSQSPFTSKPSGLVIIQIWSTVASINNKNKVYNVPFHNMKMEFISSIYKQIHSKISNHLILVHIVFPDWIGNDLGVNI